MKYNEAVQLFATAKNKESGKPIGNNTRLVKTDKGYGIKLHSTIIIEILSDRYILNNGDWFTLTTKARMNEYLPCTITQSKKIWYINNTLYYNGMEIGLDGKPLKPLVENKGSKAKQAKLNKTIKKYVDGFIKHIETNGLDNPGPGDCWYCSMIDKATGKSIGENNMDHLIQHFEDNYYVPSLLYNAIKESDRDIGFAWSTIKMDLESGKCPWFVRNDLNKYFKNRFHKLLEEI